MSGYLRAKTDVKTLVAGGLIAFSLALAPLMVIAQPPSGHENQQRERRESHQHPRAQRQGQNMERQRPRVEQQRRRTEHNRYEWRRNRYIVARPPAPVRALPRGHVTVRIGGRHYYEQGGHYYVQRPGGFVLVAPPIGVVVASLPLGAISVHIGGIAYFLAGGVYYRHAPQGYVVVTAPEPAHVVVTGIREVVVQAALLNVRSGPGLEFSVVAGAEHGTSLPVFGDAPGWYYVRLPDGLYGWVMAQFTIPVHVGPEG